MEALIVDMRERMGIEVSAEEIAPCPTARSNAKSALNCKAFIHKVTR